MAFISKDFRSPGEAWVKTKEGWERLKVLECSGKRKRHNCEGSNCHDSGATESKEGGGGVEYQVQGGMPPHYHITLRCTREIAGFNGLSEAVKRLDFRRSVRDRKRFHYICAFLLLVSNKGIASLPGSAQRQLLQMVEEVASHVNDSQQHLNVLRGLALKLDHIVDQEKQKCWGKPLGSTYLWQEHVATIKRINDVANQIQIRAPDPKAKPQLHELPEECVREIILCIADHRDLESAAQAWDTMAKLVCEQRIWRELTRFHFNQQQINIILDLEKFKKMGEEKDWKKIYHQLRRTYGVNDDYQFAEVLALCSLCCCLFWPSDGHPCIMDQSPDFRQRVEEARGQLAKLAQPVPPAQFLKYFSL
ncbi:F-box only protein 32 [Drosophila tropicalis]|uniref:F-box only protein 32 n=1 Tax=Drosophila tropicalis TaxID=46794 RepID=UPI0035AB88A9